MWKKMKIVVLALILGENFFGKITPINGWRVDINAQVSLVCKL
jgi:hypothetical protein